MIDRLKQLFGKEPDLVAIRAQYDSIYEQIESMEANFTKGGPLTWEQLQTYQISTADKPIGYPTGKHCMSYRLPDQDGKMMFLTLCVAPEGEKGAFGWHWHPKAKETNIQLLKNTEHHCRPLPPFSVTVFAPGDPHDYIVESGGGRITFFEKVIA